VTRSNSSIIRAVKEAGTIAGAARLLGIKGESLRKAIIRRGLRDAVENVRKRRHPAFVDMTGKVCGDWTVLERAANTSNGNAQWLCKHSCGHHQVVQGIALRSGPPRCKGCNA
jgi:hypothetical protein